MMIMEEKKQNHLLTKDETTKNVTKDILPRISKKYMDSISKVTKEGSVYEITFAEGYTIFGQKTRKCRNIPGIMWYSKIATEEKEEGKFNFEKWKNYFIENKVVWDGKNIPEYIETKQQIKARKEKEAKTLKLQLANQKIPLFYHYYY